MANRAHEAQRRHVCDMTSDVQLKPDSSPMRLVVHQCSAMTTVGALHAGKQLHPTTGQAPG
jgi:hypothetical protein